MIEEREGVRIVSRLHEVPDEVSRLCRGNIDVGYDVESTGLDPINDKLVTVTLKPKGRKCTIIDVRHFSHDDQHALGVVLTPLFDGQRTTVGHNIKFDLQFA